MSARGWRAALLAAHPLLDARRRLLCGLSPNPQPCVLLTPPTPPQSSSNRDRYVIRDEEGVLIPERCVSGVSLQGSGAAARLGGGGAAAALLVGLAAGAAALLLAL